MITNTCTMQQSLHKFFTDNFKSSVTALTPVPATSPACPVGWWSLCSQRHTFERTRGFSPGWCGVPCPSSHTQPPRRCPPGSAAQLGPPCRLWYCCWHRQQGKLPWLLWVRCYEIHISQVQSEVWREKRFRRNQIEVPGCSTSEALTDVIHCHLLATCCVVSR